MLYRGCFGLGFGVYSKKIFKTLPKHGLVLAHLLNFLCIFYVCFYVFFIYIYMYFSLMHLPGIANSVVNRLHIEQRGYWKL